MIECMLGDSGIVLVCWISTGWTRRSAVRGMEELGDE